MMGNKINLPPFYVGQRVAYITGIALPRNSEWVIKDIWLKPCGHYSIDIGITEKQFLLLRCHCGKETPHIRRGVMWFSASSFAPIEQTFQSISFEKVIEKETPLIGVN